jgi:putative mycofactocin binding protein MftB
VNPTRPYRLATGVVIRREAFGGLAYDHRRRCLSVIHSPAVALFLAGLTGAAPLAAEVAAFVATQQPGGIDAEALLPALARIAALGLIEPAAA